MGGWTEIPDITYEQLPSIPNGFESRVIPFSNCSPTSVNFHGTKRFSYDQFGIHLGQEDRLIFLGPPDKVIHLEFVDCRHGSDTLHRHVSVELHPHSERMLVIPRGVAHILSGLEGIFTLNIPRIFLPLKAENPQYRPEADVLNVPRTSKTFPVVKVNDAEASYEAYEVLARLQKVSIPKGHHEFPAVREIRLAGGKTARVAFRRRLTKRSGAKSFQPLRGIDGLGWIPNLSVRTGVDSGFVVFASLRPFHIIDHGRSYYANDSFGLHVMQEDLLTYFGPKDQKFRAFFVDCREKSRTLHSEVEVNLTSDPNRTLVIPPGVAHRFEGLENIFTRDDYKFYLPDFKELERDPERYDIRNDIIDVPIRKRPYPIVRPMTREAPNSFYRYIAKRMAETLKEGVKLMTPASMVTQDERGRPIKVTIRKRLDAALGISSVRQL